MGSRVFFCHLDCRAKGFLSLLFNLADTGLTKSAARHVAKPEKNTAIAIIINFFMG
jgi:hypothetical protein